MINVMKKSFKYWETVSQIKITKLISAYYQSRQGEGHIFKKLNGAVGVLGSTLLIDLSYLMYCFVINIP